MLIPVRMEAWPKDRIEKRSSATASVLDGNGLLMEAASADYGPFSPPRARPRSPPDCSTHLLGNAGGGPISRSHYKPIPSAGHGAGGGGESGRWRRGRDASGAPKAAEEKPLRITRITRIKSGRSVAGVKAITRSVRNAKRVTRYPNPMPAPKPHARKVCKHRSLRSVRPMWLKTALKWGNSCDSCDS